MRRFTGIFFILPLLFLLWEGVSPGDARGSNGTVGVEICKGCHEDHFNTYMISTHSKKSIPGSPASKDGCESCHGPGAAHVEKSGEGGVGIFIFSKKLADAKAKSAKCLECHSEQRDLSFWEWPGIKPKGFPAITATPFIPERGKI